jgi:hypothetical protein
LPCRRALHFAAGTIACAASAPSRASTSPCGASAPTLRREVLRREQALSMGEPLRRASTKYGGSPLRLGEQAVPLSLAPLAGRLVAEGPFSGGGYWGMAASPPKGRLAEHSLRRRISKKECLRARVVVLWAISLRRAPQADARTAAPKGKGDACTPHRPQGRWDAEWKVPIGIPRSGRHPSEGTTSLLSTPWGWHEQVLSLRPVTFYPACPPTFSGGDASSTLSPLYI